MARSNASLKVWVLAAALFGTASGAAHAQQPSGPAAPSASIEHHPERTAISRGASNPIKAILGHVAGKTLDFGAGRGADVLYMREHGIDAVGWDPNFTYAPDGTATLCKNDCPFSGPTFDTITSTYVMNVLPPPERQAALRHIRSLLKPGGTAYVSVRADPVTGTPHADGVLTSKGTFQKQFTAEGFASEVPGSRVIARHPGHVTIAFGPRGTRRAAARDARERTSGE